MDDEKFWKIIEASRSAFDPARRDGNMDAQTMLLGKLLRELSAAEITEFDRAFDERMRRAYHWDLWGAATIITGGCSDDGFSDFRSWLISMGRDAYEAALRDPESLIEIARADGVEDTFYQEFRYVAREVYEEMTGEEMPDTSIEPLLEPAGETWSDADLPARFPRLWQRYGG